MFLIEHEEVKEHNENLLCLSRIPIINDTEFSKVSVFCQKEIPMASRLGQVLDNNMDFFQYFWK